MIALALAVATVAAPVTSVTVYSDRARVTRTAAVGGGDRVELPLLPDTVDPASIRIEGRGVEVRRVDIAHVDATVFPQDEARALLNRLDALDDDIARRQGDRAACALGLHVLEQLAPEVPKGTALQPPPRLDASGWPAGLRFIATWSERLGARVQKLDAELTDLARDRERVAAEARLVGGARRRAGWRVTVMLASRAPGVLALSYLAARARWRPTYDLRLDGETSRVTITFAGLVSQETGEDWDDAELVLSTAVPATAATMPKLLVWKIGERERFVPTPAPATEPYPAPPRASPPVAAERTDEVLRARLLARASGSPPSGQTTPQTGKEERDRDHDAIADEEDADGMAGGGKASSRAAGPGEATELAPMAREERREVPRPPPPPSAPTSMPAPSADVAPTEVALSAGAYKSVTTMELGRRERAPQPVAEVGLAAPPAWVRPAYAPDLPASLAGGYDLSFPSLRREIVRSGGGARRVALLSETWPVAVERKLFPALAPDAFLVAEIRNPSTRVLPGGHADLYVGADPAGVAELKLVAPGEPFTLPLGLDRALRPIRNVRLSTVEKGLFSKDEITEYVVTIEIANPYRAPVVARVIDQIPVSDQKDLEVKLLRTEPGAALDAVKGSLTWRVTLAPSSRTTLSFAYSLRRPKGWRLHQ